MTHSDVVSVDKFLDDWNLRRLELHRQHDFEGWSESSPAPARQWIEDPSNTAIPSPWVEGEPSHEDIALAAQIKRRVMTRLHKETK